jgi:hypothetical protein
MSIIQKLYDLGFSIIPVPWGEKITNISWKRYQSERALPDHLNKWFSSSENSNVAILTGRLSGVIAVDADSPEAVEWVENNLLPTPMMTKTPDGGHYYYKHPGGEIPNKVKITVDGKQLELDVRGDGGYVIAPGSKHPNGSMYEKVGSWNLDDVPVYDPNWFPTQNNSDDNLIGSVPSSPGEQIDAFLRARKYLDVVPGAIEGKGGDTHTFATACTAVLGFGLDYDKALMLLSEWNLKKCDPPWSDEELEIKLQNALKYGTEVVGSKNLHSAQTYIGCADVQFIHIADCEEPGPTKWLIDQLIPSSHTSMIYGEGGHGKTYLTIYLAQCVTLGKPFMEFDTEQSNVLYLDWEMCEEEHLRRAYKVARGLGFEKIPTGYFYYRPYEKMDVIIQKIKEKVKDHDIGLLIIDSMGLGSGVDQESASQIIPLYAEINRLGLTTLIIDHQSKTQDGQRGKNKTAFGSVYKFNSSRSVLHLIHVSNDENHNKLLLEQTKNNFGTLQGLVPIASIFDQDSVRFEKAENLDGYEKELNTEDLILLKIDELEPVTAEDIAKEIDSNKGTVRNRCARMVKAGKLKIVGKSGAANLYSLTDSNKRENTEDNVEYTFADSKEVF